MRRITLCASAIILLFGITSCEKKEVNELPTEQVPIAVQKSFHEQHSEIDDVDWKSANNFFEASYEDGEKEYSIIYDEEGNQLGFETEEEIDFVDLPENAKASFQTTYSLEDIKEVEMETTQDGVFYEVELEIESLEIELTYNAQGELIETESDDTDDDDDDDDE